MHSRNYCANVQSGLHVPVINVPGLIGANGIPVGISLVAARNHDQHLLKMGQTLGEMLMSEGGWKGDVDDST